MLILSAVMSCKVVQHMRLIPDQEELPALPDFASLAWGEGCLLPFVNKSGKQFHVHMNMTNVRGFQAGREERLEVERSLFQALS